MEAKKYLTELINYKRDIDPHKIILIKAPTGSGKNHFMGHLALGKIPGSGNPSILLVTSRRGTVNQTICDENLLAVFAKLKGLRVDEGQLWQMYQLATIADGSERYAREDKGHSCVMTLSQLATLYDRVYDLGPDAWEQYFLWPWLVWDVLIIDEVHSLLRDASFSLAMPHVLDMMRAFSRATMPESKKLVMQSACPECIAPLLQEKLGEYHFLVYSNCQRVIPSAVKWVRDEDIRQEIISKVRQGQKVVYFYQGRKMTADKFLGLANADLLSKSVSIFTTDPEELEKLKQTNVVAWNNIIKTLSEIEAKGKLPDDIDLVISTSKWREGLNIKNRDIKWVYVDTHIAADILQYTGRLRESEYTLVINHDSPNLNLNADAKIAEIASNAEKLDILNQEYQQVTAADKRTMINSLEKPELFVDGKSVPNPDYRNIEGIYFNYFSEKFQANELMVADLNYCKACNDSWARLDKTSDTSYSDYIRAIYDNKLRGVDKLVFLEHYARNLFFNMKFEVGQIYTEKKINTLKSKLLKLFPGYKQETNLYYLMRKWQYQAWMYGEPFYSFKKVKRVSTNDSTKYLLEYKPRNKSKKT